MSEHEYTSRPGSDADLAALGLTDADIERALARSVERGGRMVRRRNQRRAAFSGLGIVVLLLGGFGVLHSLSDDGGRSNVVVTPQGEAGNKVLAPGESTTTTPPVPTTTWPSVGDWSASHEGDVSVWTNPDPGPDPVVDAGNGTQLAGGEAQASAAELFSERRSGPNEIEVVFVCQRSVDHIDEVRIRRDGDRVSVQGTVTGWFEPGRCDGHQAGAGVRIPVPGPPLPADATIEAARLTP